MTPPPSEAIELIVELDPDGRVAHCNPHAQAVLGPINGTLFFGAVVDADHEAEFSDALASTGPSTFEWTVKGTDGPMTVSWHLVPLYDEGAVVGALLSGVAVDERAARVIRRLNETRYALDQACIVAVTDAKGQITHVNDRFCDVSGYARRELLGNTHRMVNSGQHPSSFFKAMWATIGRGQVWRGQICNRAKDGSFYWVETTIVPFVDRRGRPFQYMAIRTEITEQKAVEAALESANAELAAAGRQQAEEHARLIQAEKLSSVGLLAAGVAHEINNPLAGVLGCVEALRDDRVAPARREMYFATVLDGLERIQGIVRSLLNYARPSTSQQTDVVPCDLVDECVRLINPNLNRHRITLTHHREGGTSQVFGDRSQLMQAVLNVLLNARDAAPDGGTIIVDYPTDGDRLGVRVTDSGDGFAPDVIDRVTDPFFSTKPEGQGTGLGMSVTLGIVQSVGGTLQLRNNKGAEVTLWLSRGDAARTKG